MPLKFWCCCCERAETERPLLNLGRNESNKKDGLLILGHISMIIDNDYCIYIELANLLPELYKRGVDIVVFTDPVWSTMTKSYLDAAFGVKRNFLLATDIYNSAYFFSTSIQATDFKDKGDLVKQVLMERGISEEVTLFIDSNSTNILAAQAKGIQSLMVELDSNHQPVPGFFSEKVRRKMLQLIGNVCHQASLRR